MVFPEGNLSELQGYVVFSLSDRRDPGDDVPPGGILCEIEIHHFSGLVAVEHSRVLEQEIH